MPRAIPLGRTHYVQLLVYPPGPGKPRFETEAWTQEFKPPNRYGVGSVVRLGRLGLHHGQWTTRSPETMTYVASALGRLQNSSDEDEVRLISEDEMGQVHDQILRRWVQPWWHWRHWLDLALPTLHRMHLLTVDAYADVHWRWPHWFRLATHQWSRSPWTPQEDSLFDASQVTEGWEEVPAIPACGRVCSEMHTFEPPCQWAPQGREAAERSAFERSLRDKSQHYERYGWQWDSDDGIWKSPPEAEV